MVTGNLIGSTRTRTGLRIQAELDTSSYETGVKVTNKELEAVRLKKDNFHGEWNYTILLDRK
jgi:DDE family transposase